jgi:hypothetical protein
MDEAQLKREIERELRAKIEAEVEAELREEQAKARLNAAWAPHVQSANREQAWERQGAMTVRPSRESAASILGTALAEQMLAGLPGTYLEDDGFGDGTG